MKIKNLPIYVILLLIYSNLNAQQFGIPRSHEYPLKSIEEYCQKDPQKLIQKTALFYNDENQLIESQLLWLENEGRETITQYHYDEYGQLESKETSYSFNSSRDTIYLEYDSIGRVVFQGSYDSYFDNRSEIRDGTTFKYEGGSDKLVEMILKFGARKTVHRYEFNSNGQVEYQYSNDKLIMESEYDGDLLTKQINHLNGTKIFTYEYDSDGNLVRFYWDNELRVENIYKDGLLVERRLNQKEKEKPCKGQCCGRSYSKYEYY